MQFVIIDIFIIIIHWIGDVLIRNDLNYFVLFQHENETKESGPIPARLFELKIVNHSGNADLRSLNYDDTNPLKLSCRQYLCAEWYPKLKEKYFNMKAAEV